MGPPLGSNLFLCLRISIHPMAEARLLASDGAHQGTLDPTRSFQGLILALQQYWANWGCVILKPSPPDIQDLYLNSLKTIGIDPKIHDIRFVEDDWESPTLGAWGLGWECWCDGMEVSQFTYFQQVAGFECSPVAGELTYGLERLAMYVQGVDNVYALNFNGRTDDKKVTYGDVFLQAEQEYSRHNFEFADTAMLFEQFKMAEAACRKYLAAGWADGKKQRHLMALPAYDQCIKASHVFNLLDARGVISVTERQSYILRVRELAKACGEAWVHTEAGRAT